ncbi:MULTISPECIES: hypothetical protein [unclassified Curtobacterium]|uniref:hypothetical protein n=1 Tax=unclassified Curtobacterium TaxID=257496 RepID=UPI0011B69C3E|nr:MULTISPECIES: hypothetical protein [unclassified Curtobacterium]WIB14852.1 hypothetical protein DEJ34_11955 [Curtobacterium sp. MCPF17_050]
MSMTTGPIGARGTTLVVATVLTSVSAGALLVLWAALWLPVLLRGADTALFLWPLVVVLAVGPWCGSVAALVLAAVALGGRRAPTAATAVLLASALVVVVAPVALWFGAPTPLGV